MVSCCSHRMVISVYDTGQLQVNHRNIVLAVYVFTHLWPFSINRRWSFWQNEECKFLVLLCYIFIVIMKRKWLKEVGYDYEPEGMIQQLTTTHFWVMIDFSILWRLKSSVAHFHVQLSNVCVYFFIFFNWSYLCGDIFTWCARIVQPPSWFGEWWCNFFFFLSLLLGYCQ